MANSGTDIPIGLKRDDRGRGHRIIYPWRSAGSFFMLVFALVW